MSTAAPKDPKDSQDSADQPSSLTLSPETRKVLETLSPDILAEALAQKLAIAPNDWHRLSANRNVRAREQAASALVYMLKDNAEEAIPRLNQAIGWLNKTLKAPPCPTHGEKKQHGKP